MKDLHAKLLADFGIDFSDLNLLETAFTHTSYANEHRLLKISHNERLEFLGDAVLQLMISKYLYQNILIDPKVRCPSCVRPLYVRSLWLVFHVLVVLIGFFVLVRGREVWRAKSRYYFRRCFRGVLRSSAIGQRGKDRGGIYP